MSHHRCLVTHQSLANPPSELGQDLRRPKDLSKRRFVEMHFIWVEDIPTRTPQGADRPERRAAR